MQRRTGAGLSGSKTVLQKLFLILQVREGGHQAANVELQPELDVVRNVRAVGDILVVERLVQRDEEFRLAARRKSSSGKIESR